MGRDVENWGFRVERAGGPQVRKSRVGVFWAFYPKSPLLLAHTPKHRPHLPSDKLVNKVQERKKLKLGKSETGSGFEGGGGCQSLGARKGFTPRAVSTAQRGGEIITGPRKEGQAPLPGMRSPLSGLSRARKTLGPEPSAKMRKDRQEFPD